MHLALTFPFDETTLHRGTRLLARAEELGYQEAWAYERNVFDAFSPLAAAAVTTRGIRLGASVVPAFTRPPGLIAMSAASVAELAPGRFVLGLGASTPNIVTGWMGLPFARPRDRVRETTLAVRALLEGERVGGMRLHRAPSCSVPLYLAALGERMLALAREVADGLVFFMAGPGIVPELLASAGGRLDSVARVVVVAGRHHVQNLRLAAGFVAGYVMVPAYAAFLTRQGFGDEVREVQARWSAGGRAAAATAIPEAMVRELVLIATDAGVAERVRAYEQAGLGVLDFWFMSPAESADDRRRDVEQALERFSPVATARGEGELLGLSEVKP